MSVDRPIANFGQTFIKLRSVFTNAEQPSVDRTAVSFGQSTSQLTSFHRVTASFDQHSPNYGQLSAKPPSNLDDYWQNYRQFRPKPIIIDHYSPDYRQLRRVLTRHRQLWPTFASLWLAYTIGSGSNYGLRDKTPINVAGQYHISTSPRRALLDSEHVKNHQTGKTT